VIAVKITWSTQDPVQHIASCKPDGIAPIEEKQKYCEQNNYLFRNIGKPWFWVGGDLCVVSPKAHDQTLTALPRLSHPICTRSRLGLDADDGWGMAEGSC